MSWVLAFLGFAALIILHEAGHFAAAKAVGMKVEKFYLFFGPKLVSVRRGETEYGIAAIPAGGYVKIAGMNPDEELPAEDAHRGYYAQPVWKRILVILAGPLMNVLIAFVILFGLGFTLEEPTALTVASVEEGTPAARALEPGDRVISINGVKPEAGSIDDKAERLANSLEGFRCPGERTDGCSASREATVVVERDGARRALTMRPFFDDGVDRFRLGLAFGGTDLVPVDLSAGESVDWALDRMWFVTSSTADVLVNLADAEKRSQISGVVGSYEITRQSFEFDTRQALGVLALISLSLALVNLLPFLPLDGGHIFAGVLEKIRGTPVPMHVLERMSAVGWILVLMLFAVGLSNDIGRLTGEGFDVR